MNTPIYDFVSKYASSGVARFHMPGHKGIHFLGCEKLDITEIDGADVLYSPNGIIAESENNASGLFGSYHSFYSTEGSTLAIKTMLGMAISKASEYRPLILAARNVHKAFVYACALLDIDVEWMRGEDNDHLCSCSISTSELLASIKRCVRKPDAIYVTSPDYLGNILDIKSISSICHDNGIPLLVDNAHGAYLAFTEPSMHPLALGADACCDSAHKTLPVLTGGAYLHISKSAPTHFKDLCAVRNTFSLFSSTSPSYLILQSLDLCNRYLHDGYRERLAAHCQRLDRLKADLKGLGYTVLASEPMKTVISCKEYGYRGYEIADILREKKIECEFADSDYVVLMSTPENSDLDLEMLYNTLCDIKSKSPIRAPSPALSARISERQISIREAILSPRKTVSVVDAVGRVCASPSVSCPPAVPIAVSGEVITPTHAELFKAYGIDHVEVIDK